VALLQIRRGPMLPATKTNGSRLRLEQKNKVKIQFMQRRKQVNEQDILSGIRQFLMAPTKESGKQKKGSSKMRKHILFRVLCVLSMLSVTLLATACGKKKPETFTIGVINVTPAVVPTMKGFKASMTDSGYIEGENVSYIYQEQATSIDDLESVAQSLVDAKVDLIVGIGLPAVKAAQRVTAGTDVPVVFLFVDDPIRAGLVDSLRQPGGSLTGITTQGTQVPRRLEWLVKADPTIEQVYIPYNPDDPPVVASLQAVSEAASKLDVELVTREVRNAEEVAAAAEDIPPESDAVFLLPDRLVISGVDQLTAASLKLRLPFGAGTREAEKGALLSYSVMFSAVGGQAAHLADQILQGTDPGDLPVEMAEFFLLINLKTADAIGLEIPDDVLEAAETLIR
jgi:putative ABC transport system substrate-binding protein